MTARWALMQVGVRAIVVESHGQLVLGRKMWGAYGPLVDLDIFIIVFETRATSDFFREQGIASTASELIKSILLAIPFSSPLLSQPFGHPTFSHYLDRGSSQGKPLPPIAL